MNISVVSPFPVFPVNTGGARRTMALADHLLRQGHSVSLFCPFPRGETTQTPPDGIRWRFFRQWPSLLAYFFHAGLFRAILRHAKKDGGAIVLSFPFHALPVFLAAKLARIPFYLDAHNVEHDRYFSMKRPGVACGVFLMELLAVRTAREVFAVSEQDRALFQKRFRRPVRLAPNGVDITAFSPEARPSGSSKILFFGNLAYSPNRQAVCFINAALAPLLAKELPGVRLCIAGPYAPPNLHYAPNVELLGEVPRVQDALAESSLVIVPLDAAAGGGGTRLKILEAMACGKNVLSTPAGAAGLPEDILRTLRIADLKDFGAEIIDFYAGRWPRDLGAPARRAAASMAWENCFKELQIA